MIDSAHKLTLSTAEWEVETSDFDRYGIRVNAWWGDWGPDDAFLWLQLPPDDDEFVRRLRGLAVGDLVDLSVERGAGPEVLRFEDAVVVSLSALVHRSGRPPRDPFCKANLTDLDEELQETGEIAMTLRLPGAGYFFGPGGPLRQIVRLRSDRAARRSFVVQSMRELEAAHSWDTAAQGRDADSESSPSP